MYMISEITSMAKEKSRINSIEFGKFIAHRRTHIKGIQTQSQLAKKVGVTTGTIGKIETGDRLPSFDLFIELANELHMPPGELMEVMAELSQDEIKTKFTNPIRAHVPVGYLNKDELDYLNRVLKYHLDSLKQKKFFLKYSENYLEDLKGNYRSTNDPKKRFETFKRMLEVQKEIDNSMKSIFTDFRFGEEYEGKPPPKIVEFEVLGNFGERIRDLWDRDPQKLFDEHQKEIEEWVQNNNKAG